MKKTTKVVSNIIAVIYIPFYLVGWCLHKVARLLLAIAYSLLLDYKKAKDIITNLFSHI